MNRLKLAVAVITLTMASTVPAVAQEPGNVGLTMTSESTVGLTIEASKWLAVRPEVGFTRSTSENTNFTGATNETTSTSWSPGLSVLFYVKSWDGTRLYLSPQWTHSKSSTGGATATSSGQSVSAMIGAQHAVTDRFAVFGEVGLNRSTTENESQFSSNSSRVWKTRSAVGAILFF